MIILQNVYKDYKVGNTKVHALKNISLEFESSGFVCIHGPSGCGKTTLLNIIGGLDKRTSGKLIVNKFDTSNFKEHEWDSYRNQEIGFVFQNYYLLPQLNVYENIEIALDLINIEKSKKEEMIYKALESVGLTDQTQKMPNQLSGGQIQRVAIARAIVNEPSIVLADEPTGALDSKNAILIMNILKEISKSRLVILVSHNISLAKTYADRIIEILDGEVVEDTGNNQIKKDKRKFDNKKTSMKFVTSLKIGIRNLVRKKLRTPLIIFAGSIGMVGIGLVLSISKGVNIYIDDVQRSALENYPIEITSSAKILRDDGTAEVPLKKYPDVKEIFVRRGISKYDFYNVMDEEVIDHLEELDPKLYSLIKYNRRVSMNLISDSYERIYSYFYEMTEDLNFMSQQFDTLYGEFPSTPNELALVVSDDNSIDESLLNSLRFETENRDALTFSEIINKEYRVIDNNDFYTKFNDRYINSTYFDNVNNQTLYEGSKLKLKITAIIRPKPNSGENVYTNGILYAKELTDLVLKNNLESDIVKEQMEHLLDKDVMTGKAFEIQTTSSYTRSKEYQLDNQLVNLGAIPETIRIQIYTKKFSDRLEIKKYFDEYINLDSKVNITFRDRLNNTVNEFSELTKVFSTVLIIFSSVSLVVSAIMIGIITYVSVIQRTKEIGLLRSIGTRKKDVSRLFNVETLLIGFFSGLLGIVGVFLFLNPVNSFVQEIVKEYTVLIRGVETVIIARFELIYMIILLFGSMLLSLISGFIPAFMASRKSPIDALRNER